MTKTEFPPLPEPAEMLATLTPDGVEEVPHYTADQMIAYAAGAVAAKRDRCAKICEDNAPAAPSYFEIAERLRECAAEIRRA